MSTLAMPLHADGSDRCPRVMATRLDGRQLAATIEERLQAVVADRLERAGRRPGLAVLRVRR